MCQREHDNVHRNRSGIIAMSIVLAYLVVFAAGSRQRRTCNSASKIVSKERSFDEEEENFLQNITDRKRCAPSFVCSLALQAVNVCARLLVNKRGVARQRSAYLLSKSTSTEPTVRLHGHHLHIAFPSSRMHLYES
jgi:hypothetical protein